ncbi:hypothetical protein DDD64_08585 [Actinotignum sanguinis]|uniref:FIVAR domain-containing protein n=1 Tax=Actinotignum sanguinis TaxID=1445614 RepID=UPI000F7E4DB1|nr:FIVAR domain-containing protein [Actinotignum sanguinis]RTE47619.1 hypothetical protein DDD64_08585 [Actinotignum sanguinis]
MDAYQKGQADTYYHDLLQKLPETVRNNDLSDDAFNAEAEKLGLVHGAIQEVTELGGWKAINNGKILVAKAREDGLFLNSTVGTAISEGGNTLLDCFVDELSTGTHPYLLALGKAWDAKASFTNVKSINEKNLPPKRDGDSPFAEPFYGIEREFKAYAPEHGTKVVVDFSTGSLARTNRAAGYTVRVLTTQAGTDKEIYSASFNPGDTASTPEYTVTPFGNGTKPVTLDATPATAEEIANKTAIAYFRGKDKQKGIQYATQFNNARPVDFTNVKPGATGRFTSKPIDLPVGVTAYKVQITPDFSSTSGAYERWGHSTTLNEQRSPDHYVTPLFDSFNVDQKTDPVAKALLREQLDALKKVKDATIVDKSNPSIDTLNKAIAAAEAAVTASDLKSAAEYKELGEQLKTAKDSLIDIAPALAQVRGELAKKIAELDAAPGARTGDKEAAKEAAQKIANTAIAALKEVAQQSDIQPILTTALENIRAVTVSNKEALIAKVNEDATFKATPQYRNTSNPVFLNEDGTPNTDKNDKAAAAKQAYDQAVLDAQSTIMNPVATQDEVDAALKTLNDARTEVEKYATDKAKLEASINQDEATKASPAYTNASADNASEAAKEAKKNYDAALEAARKVFEDPAATQAAVDQATTALDEARAKLIDAAKTDKAKLEASINQDEATKASAKYPAAPEELRKAYEDALAKANQVLGDANATQAQVDEATAALDEARAKINNFKAPNKAGKVVKKGKKQALQHTGAEIALSAFLALSAISAGAALVYVRRRKAE